jgi:esterase/lipase
MKHILRTRFKKEIVAEFLSPARKSRKVMILCSGMPSYPGNRQDMIRFLADEGYWVIVPRYRGSWESAGRFLAKSPHQDILDVMRELPQGFVELWNKKKYKITNPEVYLIGASFGGPAAILASSNKLVEKVALLSPVVDWRKPGPAEPFDKLQEFTALGFGNAYRINKRDWKKLESGEFYNPVNHLDEVDGSKMLVFHSKDDKLVPFETAHDFSQKTDAQLVTLQNKGHLGFSDITLPFYWKKISSFFQNP